LAACSYCRGFSSLIEVDREREKFIIRQPPIGEKDDYDSENSWISDGLPSSSRRRRRVEMRGEGGESREKWSASGVNVAVDSAKSEIKVERRYDLRRSAKDFAESVIKITVIGIVVVVNGHHNARTDIVMPVRRRHSREHWLAR